MSSSTVPRTDEDSPAAPPERRTPGDQARKPRKRTSGASRTLPYLLILPSLVAIVLMLGYPVLRSALISFQKLDSFEFFQRKTVWVGLENYRTILRGSEFWTVTLRTVVFMVVNVALTIVIGVGIALLMAQLARGIRLALSIALILTWATPVITATVVFQWLFDQQFGVVNWVLTKLGGDFERHAWFSSGLSTFFVITLLIVWQAVPFVTMSTYAQMTSVPVDRYEAAALDGAGGLQAFRAVTWPAIRGMVLILTFLSVIWDFKVFTQIYAFRQGGPNRETTTLSLYSYVEGIGSRHFGVAAASSLLMVLMLMVVLVFYIRSMMRSLEDEL